MRPCTGPGTPHHVPGPGTPRRVHLAGRLGGTGTVSRVYGCTGTWPSRHERAVRPSCTRPSGLVHSVLVCITRPRLWTRPHYTSRHPTKGTPWFRGRGQLDESRRSVETSLRLVPDQPYTTGKAEARAEAGPVLGPVRGETGSSRVLDLASTLSRLGPVPHMTRLGSASPRHMG